MRSWILCAFVCGVGRHGKKNWYPWSVETSKNKKTNIIRNGRQRNRQQEIYDTDQRGLVILPCAKGFSERVTKVLRSFNIKVAHKPIRSTLSVYQKRQDRARGFQGNRVQDCDCVFVCQASRALKTRVKERTRAIATLDENSLLAKHHMLHSYQIDLESVEIVDRSSAWQQRLILEAWDSMRDRNAINERITLPNIYNNIKNF